MRKSLEQWTSWVGIGLVIQLAYLATSIGRTETFGVLDVATFLVFQVVLFGGCAFRAGLLYQRELSAATEPESS